jgi:hypothetical protein
MLDPGSKPEMVVPWAMRMQAVALEEPDRLVRNLTTAILNCGGWILSRGASDTGTVTLLFEFERHNCVEIYSGLVGVGVELSRDGHLRFTELCQCARNGRNDRHAEIASVELEIQTYPIATTTGPHTSPAA